MITLNSYCAMMVTTSLRKASYHPRPSHNTSNLLESVAKACSCCRSKNHHKLLLISYMPRTSSRDSHLGTYIQFANSVHKTS